MTEGYMIKLLKERSEDAFEYCYHKYVKLVFLISYQIIGQYQSAEENTQNVFLKMYQQINSFDGQFFKAWLAKIAKNEALNYKRTIRKNVVYQDSYFFDEMVAPQETVSLLMEIADYLTPEQYEVVIQKLIYNMKGTEIAEYLGWQQSKVSRVYNEAIEILKLKMKE